MVGYVFLMNNSKQLTKTVSYRELENFERFAALQLNIINHQVEITTTRRHMLLDTFLMYVLVGCCGK